MICVTIDNAKKVADEYSAFLRFPYNSDIVNKIKAYPCRYYHKETTEWEIPINKVNEFLSFVNTSEVTISGKLSELAEKKISLDIPKEVKFKTEPLPHQWEGIKFGIQHDRWFLGDEMGCLEGSTFVSVRDTPTSKIKPIMLNSLYNRWVGIGKRYYIACYNKGKRVYLPIKNICKRGNKDTIKLIFDDRELICTKDHPILTPEGYVEAGKLPIGNTVVVSKNARIIPIILKGVEPYGKSTTYDIEVDHEEIHNFFANGIVVHNCGKSLQSLELAIIKKHTHGFKHCLVVCGVNTLKWNWVNEIHKHSYEEAWILGQKMQRNGKIRIGSSTDKLKDLQKVASKEDDLPYFLITNIESFRTANIADAVKKLCDNGTIGMMIVDEFHKIKSPTCAQSKGLLKCLPKCRLAMTGTPLLNTPLDLYTLLHWLGYETHSFYSFKNHYCVMGGYGGYEIIGYKNIDQLTAQVKEIMVRRLKDDLFDLPEKNIIDEYVEMEKAQEGIYNEVESDIKVNIDNIKMQNNPLSNLIRLRQATGYTGILSSVIKESAKLDRMCDIVEEIVSNGRKVIIYSNWTQITDIVAEKLSNYKIGVITGDTKDGARQEIVEAFQTPNNAPMHDRVNSYGQIDVLIGTIGALGTGLTLTAASYVIFLDEPWNRGLYDQAVDRAHRIGQNKSITVINLITKNTIDERIHELVYQKGQLSDAIIDGHIVGDKKQILEYLLK